MVYRTGDNNFGTAKWIVSATAGQGTHTTIASAITSASSGDTIFIRPGTYTEDLTLKPGVNLAAYNCDSLNLDGTTNVIISGVTTLTSAGTVSISGVNLQTNSGYCIVVSGANDCDLLLTNCYINCSNNNGIHFTNSNSASNIFVQYSNTATASTFTLYDMTATGSLAFYYCSMGSSSTVASSNSAGTVTVEYCNSNVVMSTTSSGVVAIVGSDIVTNTNATALTTAGTGSSFARISSFAGGTASAISIGTGTTVSIYDSTINSSNTNAITGAGTINYSGLSFSGSSVKINTTTQTGGLLQGGVTQAPSAGFIGEQLRSTASSVSLSNATAKTITSVSLTAGMWDVTVIAYIANTGVTTAYQLAISPTDNTISGALVVGDQVAQFAQSLTGQQITLSVPNFRLTLTATATYYCVGLSNFSTGTCSANGRISATRVG